MNEREREREREGQRESVCVCMCDGACIEHECAISFALLIACGIKSMNECVSSCVCTCVCVSLHCAKNQEYE